MLLDVNENLAEFQRRNSLGFPKKTQTIKETEKLKNNVPRSSRIHRFADTISRERKKLLSGRVTFLLQLCKKTKRLQVQTRRRRKQTAASETSVFHFRSGKIRCKFSTKVLNPNNSEATSTYKNLNHRMNYCKFNLCRDINKYPGLTFIDPSKTLHAPDSQGNVALFGQNVGQQCVAMSLCDLIHNSRNKSVSHTISYPEHLIQIMNIGIELYYVLSRLARQFYLLLTELPTMVSAKHKLST